MQSMPLDILFQLTAARRRLGIVGAHEPAIIVVSTHSRPKAAGLSAKHDGRERRRFNSQPPEGGWYLVSGALNHALVSTHSRPKAAGFDGCFAIRIFTVSTHSRPKAAGGSFVKIGF